MKQIAATRTMTGDAKMHTNIDATPHTAAKSNYVLVADDTYIGINNSPNWKHYGGNINTSDAYPLFAQRSKILILTAQKFARDIDTRPELSLRHINIYNV